MLCLVYANKRYVVADTVGELGDCCKLRRSIAAEPFSLTTIENLKYKTAELLISGMYRQSELPRSPSPQSLFGNAVVMS